MQKHHANKPGLQCAERSSAMVVGRPIARGPRAGVALLALFGLTLDSLGSAIAWLDEAAFERYCRVVDGSGLAASIQLIVCFGPAAWLLARDLVALHDAPHLLGWQKRALWLLDCLALVQLAAYVLLLRLPWVAEQAAPRNRVDLWSARLSETIQGVPLVAFLLSVGFGVLFVAVCAAAQQALRNSGFMQNDGRTSRFAAAVWLVCSVDCALTLLTLNVFATGGVF